MTIPASLLDTAWYLAQVGQPLTDPVQHFRTTGDAAGLDPSPYFSTRFYKSTYPDWPANGAATALEDFLCHEQSGRFRRSHPLIDPEAYLGRHPDLEAEDVCPTLHLQALAMPRAGRPPRPLTQSSTQAAICRLGRPGLSVTTSGRGARRRICPHRTPGAHPGPNSPTRRRWTDCAIRWFWQSMTPRRRAHRS